MADRTIDVQITIRCPGCGTSASIRADRLNQRLVCKNCSTKLYIDESGRLCVGDPPDRTRKKGIQKYVSQVEKWVASNRLLAIISGTAVLSVGIWFLSLWWFSTGSVLLPPSLLGRADFVCDGVFRNDSQRISSVCTSSTRSEGANFLRKVREYFKEGTTVPDPSKFTKCRENFRNDREGIANILAILEVPTEASATGEHVTLQLILHFERIGNDDWRLNGIKTLEFLSHSSKIEDAEETEETDEG